MGDSGVNQADDGSHDQLSRLPRQVWERFSRRCARCTPTGQNYSALHRFYTRCFPPESSPLSTEPSTKRRAPTTGGGVAPPRICSGKSQPVRRTGPPRSQERWHLATLRGLPSDKSHYGTLSVSYSTHG